MKNLALGLSALFIAALLASPLAAQASGREKTFVDGLESRGLLKLLEKYLEDQSQSGDSAAIKEQQARLFEMQGNRAGAEKDRDELFGKAKQKYRELLDDLAQKIKTESDDRAKDDMHMRIIALKMRMAEMIWQREAFNQLNNLEITDRQRGDRAKVQRLLGEAKTLFQEVNTDDNAWKAEMEKATDFDKRYTGTGLYDKACQISEYSLFQLAWTCYYLGYALPDGHKDRDPLLKEAFDKFQGFAAREVAAGEEFQAKWESLKGQGMCAREQGLFDKAVETLRKAMASKAQKFNITVYYELAQTYLRAKKFVEARAVLDELRGKNLPEMNESFIGTTLMPFLDAKIALAEGQADPAKKEYALKVMRSMWDRSEFWKVLVAAEISKYIDSTKIETLKPFELWILACDAYNRAVAADAAGKTADATKAYLDAIKDFEQYVQITQPTEETHVEAIFNLGACYLKLFEAKDIKPEARADYLTKAATRFQEIVSKFPGSANVAKAQDAVVQIRSQSFASAPTDEKLEDYLKSLKQRLNSPGLSPTDVADTHWLVANVLKKQKKYLEAAQHYKLVTADSQNFYEAKFEAVECQRQDLQEIKWNNASKEELTRLVEATVTDMAGYATWAKGVADKSDAKVAENLKRNAGQTLISAAEILATDQVQQYQRALDLINQYEANFPDPELEGAAIKIKIDIYYGQGQLEKAAGLIDQLMKKPGAKDGVGAILQKIFGTMTDDVDRLIRQNRMAEAREKVKRADSIGDKFILVLGQVGLTKDVPAIEAQLAELHLRAEDLDGDKGAVKRYLALIGFDPYDNREDFLSGKKAVSLNYLTGLAKSTQALANQLLKKNEAERAYNMMLRGIFYWTNIADAFSKPSAGPDAVENTARLWDARLQQYTISYDINDLEKTYYKNSNKDAAAPTDYHDSIKQFILLQRATNSNFGGPAMKIQFDRLAQRVGL